MGDRRAAGISTKENNICSGCPTYCCIGFGRMLVNHEELERLGKFSGLKVEKEGRLYRVSVARAGDSCPYLVDHRCTNYDERPFDCRLYPVIVEETMQTNDEVIAFYRFHRRCPQVKLFRLAWKKNDLNKIEKWLKRAYPDKKIKLIYRRDDFIRRNFARLKRLLASIFG